MILKYIARAAAPGTPSLYGNSALESCMIDEWMDFCNSHFVSGPGLQAAVASAGACFKRIYVDLSIRSRAHRRSQSTPQCFGDIPAPVASNPRTHM
jgi:hypothetical protein